MRKEILVVLGSPNSSAGVLSDIARTRLDYCAQVYTNEKAVICTGGWGVHFNTAKEAHAVYAERYLVEKGIPATAFLGPALSSNTVDDAVKVKKVVAGIDDASLLIVTSDYHLERVKIIFQEIVGEFDLSFVGVSSDLEEEARQRLVAHEQEAVANIVAYGLRY